MVMLDDDSQTVELAGIEENQQILIEGTRLADWALIN